ncbi:GNAT family N-acetyltransferase [Yoonia sp. R2331]|uniref:GNAT family N-acetyltransferase n=1 Tax=Yoonia sp. R2331 TaxID=3237238 RepID=UPI0034E5C0F0
MDTITLRVLGPDDFELLMAVTPGLFDAPMRADQARAFLDNPMHVCVLAFEGDLAVAMATGTVLLHPDKAPAMFINEIGTRDAYQRRGIGTRVTQALIDLARKRGCEGVWLGTEHDNAAALGLYRSMKADEVKGSFFGWDDAL